MPHWPRWVRVRDPLTGHEFDRRTDDPALIRGRFVRVKPATYPPAATPRPPKHHLRLAGPLSASREPRRRRRRAVETPEATAEGDEDRG